MTRSPYLLCALSLLLCAQARPREVPSGTDGQYEPSTEGSYSFGCRTLRAAIRYRYVWVSNTREALEVAPPVTLVDLSVAGRRVSGGDMNRGREVLGSFAWIERVHSLCFEDQVDIFVTGMPLGPYIASLGGDAPENRPRLRSRTIRLSREGIVYVSPHRW